MEARNRANSSDSFVLVEEEDRDFVLIEEESTLGDGALSSRLAKEPLKGKTVGVDNPFLTPRSSSFIHQKYTDDEVLVRTPVLRRRRRIDANEVVVGCLIPLRNSRPVKKPRWNTAMEAIMATVSPRSKRKTIVNPYRELPKKNSPWPSTQLLCLVAIVLALLNHYEASWMPLVHSGRSLNRSNGYPPQNKRSSIHDTSPKRLSPKQKTQENLVLLVPLSQLEAFLSQHEQVLLIFGSPRERWELFARNLRDMSRLPLSVVVAKVDCTKRDGSATSRFRCPHGVSFYRDGKGIDSYTGGIDPETPVEFVRGMLALSPDTSTRNAVARLPTGYVGMSSITRDSLKIIVQEHKKATERKRNNSPNGTIFFGDDGDDWAMKAAHGDTRLVVYDRWRNSGTRYLVDETAFASFLEQNKEQAFILFCTFNTGNCNSDRNWDTMRKEKEKQLVLELPFAEVPCGLAPRLCLEQNITVYPTLRSYVNSVADESELTKTPMGAAEIVQWASRHSKLDRVPLAYSDSEVAVVSRSNYTTFARQNQFVFLYVYEEGQTSSSIERKLYKLSKQVAPLALVVAKMAIPPSILEQAPDRWGPSETPLTTWSNIVGPHGRALYYHSHKDMKRYSGRTHDEVSFIAFIQSCDSEALESPTDKREREQKAEEDRQRRDEQELLAVEQQKRNALVQEERLKKSQRDALKRALLLFDKELPGESNRLKREDAETQIDESRARHKKPRENIGKGEETGETLGDADKYPGFVEDAAGDVLYDEDTMGSDEVEVTDLD